MEESLEKFRHMMAKRVGCTQIKDDQNYWPFAYALRNSGGDPTAQLGSWFISIDELRDLHPPRWWTPTRHFDDAFDMAILDITDTQSVNTFYAAWTSFEQEDSRLAVARYWLDETKEGRKYMVSMRKMAPKLRELQNHQLTPLVRKHLLAFTDQNWDQTWDRSGQTTDLLSSLSLSTSTDHA